MMEEAATWAIYGPAATGLVFGVVFLVNLICAPYRIEREARLAMQRELAGC